MRKFKAKNIKCQNCANMIQNYFKDDYGEVIVDVDNKTVSLNLSEDETQDFYDEMKEMGFEVEQEIK